MKKKERMLNNKKIIIFSFLVLFLYFNFSSCGMFRRGINWIRETYGEGCITHANLSQYVQVACHNQVCRQKCGNELERTAENLEFDVLHGKDIGLVPVIRPGELKNAADFRGNKTVRCECGSEDTYDGRVYFVHLPNGSFQSSQTTKQFNPELNKDEIIDYTREHVW